MTTTINRVCDICNDTIINGYEFKARKKYNLFSIISLRDFRKDYGSWKKFDICSDCMNLVKKLKEEMPIRKTEKQI